MKLLLALLLGAASAHAGDMVQTNAGASPSFSTVTITGAGTACFTAGGLAINCASGSVTASSVTAQYGVRATTAAFSSGSTAVTLDLQNSVTGNNIHVLTTADGGNEYYWGWDTTNKYIYFNPDGSAVSYNLAIKANGGAPMAIFDQSSGFTCLGPACTSGSGIDPSATLQVIGSSAVVVNATGNVVLASSSTASGFGVLSAHGTSGGCIILTDTDNAGWTKCTALNGTLSCVTDADGICD